MPFNFNPATIEALAKLAQVLDQHPFGAVMLVLVMAAAAGLVAIPYLGRRRSVERAVSLDGFRRRRR